MLCVREFEPSLFEPGVYFNIKCIGKLPGPTNEFERSLVFETGEFERPKFDCINHFYSGRCCPLLVYILRGHSLLFPVYDVFLSLKIVLTSAKKV